MKVCKYCGLFSKEGCHLRFSKAKKPVYRYTRAQRLIVGDVTGFVDWCVGVYPAPRPIDEPESDSCREWQSEFGEDWTTYQKRMDDASRFFMAPYRRSLGAWLPSD